MRHNEFLKKSYATILSAISILLLIGGVIMAAPLIVLPAFPDEARLALHFLLPAIGMIATGICLHKKCKPETINLGTQDGGVVVVLGWIIIILFSALPLMTIEKLSFSLAVFESVSGWTTTGLSVVNVEKASNIILFWRSLIQLAGGAGLAIIMMSALVGPTGTSISSAEGRNDQLVPHVKSSARLVLIIYSCYALFGTLAYRLAGMTWFDAVNHAFAAVSTGGFSTRTASIGYWESSTIEIISIILMIFGNLSFVTAWLLFRGDFKSVTRNGEVRLMALVMPSGLIMAFLFTCQTLYPTFTKSLRVATFETVSALTTTGFSTVSYSNWNAAGIFILILLMLIGGGTCSTAGGIKQLRIYIACCSIYWEIRRQIMPKTAITHFPIQDGQWESALSDSRLRQIAVFIFLYLATYCIGVLTLCASGFSLPDSLFEFASALGTVGISVGVTSATMPSVALWAETLAMFLGRLEFLVVFVSLHKLIKDFFVRD